MEDVNPFSKMLSLLRTNGWCKGQLRDSEGRYCLVGAAQAASNWIPDQIHPSSEARLLKEIIRQQYGTQWIYDLRLYDLTAWNDHSSRTFEEVEAVLEKAAVRWDEERLMK